MRRHRRCGAGGTCFVYFGLGLLAYTVLPAKLVVLLLGAALVLSGLCCGN